MTFDDPKQIIETMQRNQIEEDVYQAAMRIWANPDSYAQPVFTRCTHCGEQRRCISHVVDLSTECCECYMQRRIKERLALLPKPTKQKLDLEDFVRI